tara:strand:- start:578 stop:829 length:252 start_codon:yes stop_codon:yes gene_type:complete
MKDVIVHIESTTHDKLVKLDAELPSDIHLVRYRKPTWKKKEKISAIRAYKMSDIFDALHDEGWQVLEIKQGYGRIKPKLFNPK